MTTSVTRPCFTIQHQTCKTKTSTDFFGLKPVLSYLRPTVSEHITVRDRQTRLGETPATMD